MTTEDHEQDHEHDHEQHAAHAEPAQDTPAETAAQPPSEPPTEPTAESTAGPEGHGEVELIVTEQVPDAAAARTDPPSLFDPTDTASLEARALEAILMVADQPVTPQLLGELLELRAHHVEELCVAMSQQFIDERRGFVLVRVAGGYRFQSAPDLAAYVERFVLDGQAARLSAAAMETLAIVAYKQPISRAQVASIRGVNVDGVMRTLVQRGYVAEVAIDPGPGQAALFGTTSLFLESLGLDRISQMPPLADLVPGSDVMEALEASLRIDDESGRPIRGPLSRTGGIGGSVASDMETDLETDSEIDDTGTDSGTEPTNTEATDSVTLQSSVDS